MLTFFSSLIKKEALFCGFFLKKTVINLSLKNVLEEECKNLQKYTDIYINYRGINTRSVFSNSEKLDFYREIEGI